MPPLPPASRPAAPARPEHRYQRRLMQRALVIMMLFGAVNAFGAALTVEAGADHDVAQHWQLGCATALLIFGLLGSVVRGRIMPMQLLSLGGLGVIGVLIATAPEASPGTTPFFFLWPCFWAAYFCTRRFAAVSGGVMAVIAATSLIISPHQERRHIAIAGVVSSVGLAIALVGAMRRREAALAARLEQAANTDPLTGLMNRRAFNPALEQAIANATSCGRSPLSVVLFDLDHFKRFNDRHGHLVGDDALRRMARVLEAGSRDSDLVARFGGEEFAVALPGATTEEARRYGERVLADLLGEPVDPALRLSTSVGVAAYGSGAETMDQLLVRADEALYAAKDAGRGRVAWWEDEIEIGAPPTDPDGDPGGSGPRDGGELRDSDFGVPRVLGDEDGDGTARAALLRRAG